MSKFTNDVISIVGAAAVLGALVADPKQEAPPASGAASAHGFEYKKSGMDFK